jgi:SPP1 gp7 family putative phage head morphogenesis protein
MGNVAPLQGREREAKPKLDTVTSVESVFIAQPGDWWRVNPDDLVRQKGLTIYKRMRIDDQIKAATQFKRDAITSRGWTFKFDDASKLPKEEQQRRIKVYEDIIEEFPGSFLDALNGIAAGRDYGYSLTEKVFSAITLSDGSPGVGVSALIFRDPVTFDFITDAYGFLVEFRQRVAGNVVQLDLKDFIFYVHAPEEDPYFGRSDLRAAYKWWYIKNRVQDFWALYMERLAGGFGVLTATQASAPKPGTSDYNTMVDFIANLRGSAGLLVPQGMEFKVENAQSTDAFERCIAFCDLAIARSMLVPNLMGVSHPGGTGTGTAGSGAGSQSQTQLEAFYWTLTQDQQRLEACLNEQLFKPLAALNFADEEGPCFEFKPLSEERLKWMVTTWTTLISGGAVVNTEEDEAYLRKLLGMPERDETSTPIVTPQEQLQRDQMQQDQTNADANRQAQADVAQAKIDAQQKQLNELQEKLDKLTIAFSTSKPVNVNLPAHAGTASTQPPTAGGTAEPAGHIHTHGPIVVSMSALNNALQRVAFAVIEKKQMDAVSQIVSDAAASVAGSVARLASDSRLDKALADPASIPKTKFAGDEVAELKGIIKNGLVNSYIDGVSMARNEIDRAGAKIAAKRATFASIKNVAADYLDANGFRIAGNVSDATRAIIQQEMLNGVKAGSTVKDIRTNIWNRLVSKGMTSAEAVLGVETDEAIISALNDLWVDTEKEAAAYLNTLVRTNVFDAFNEGRFAEFTDPALGGFVSAFQYSAILDDRTTELCQDLDGKVWDADNPLWDTFKPPNHFNCRSVLIAITQLDEQRGEWDGNQDPPPPADLKPADGFGPGEK